MAQSGSESFRSTIADGHDYIFDYQCDLCKQQENYVEAMGYCSDCQDYLCSECFNYHLLARPMRHHVLLDQHQMPKDQQQNSGGDTCTEACTTHPHKTVEYFCTQHDELGCSVCMTLNHRSCSGVEHIPDIASDIGNNEEYIGIQEKLTSFTHAATTAIQTSQDQAKRSESYHAKILEDFKHFKTDLSKALDRTETNLNNEADTIKANDKKKLESLENNYRDILTDIQALDSKLTSLQNNGQFCQMFIAMKHSKRELDCIDSRVGCQENNTEVTNYRLMKRREMQLLLDTPESMIKMELVKEDQSGSNPTLAAISNIQTRQTHTKAHQVVVSSTKPTTTTSSQFEQLPSVSQLMSPATPSTAAEQPSKYAMKTRAQLLHVKNIQVGPRYKYYNPGSCIAGFVSLPDDTLVVVDSSSNNDVMMIDLIRNNIVSRLRLAGQLWDIAQVGKRQVVVTSPGTQNVFVVNVKANQLKHDRNIKVKGQCLGIASINDSLVVSYVKPVKVEIINMNGQVLRTVISTDKGRQLFTKPQYVAVSKDQQTIYISDRSRDTVTRVDLTGQVQATYKDDKLWWPSGLTVDSAGRVYVCGRGSHNILQLNADLTEIQELLQESDGIAYPYSVCYCEATDRLYIGMHMTVVKVYQLK